MKLSQRLLIEKKSLEDIGLWAQEKWSSNKINCNIGEKDRSRLTGICSHSSS